MDEKKDYRYNDISERYRKMNSVFVVSATFLWAMFLLYLLFKLGVKSIARITAVSNIVLILAFLISDIVMYFRDKSSTGLKRVVAIEMAVEVLLLGLQTDAEFIFFGAIGMLALQIPYYDRKAFKKFTIAYVILSVLIVIVHTVKGIGMGSVDDMSRTLCIFLLYYVVYRVGSISKTFSDHALSSVEEQSSRQQEIMDDIIDVSRTVQDETQKSSGLVDELVRTTESVAQSMREISSATTTTARNIEEQNGMTQSIQDAIGQTGDRSKKMVAIATDSNESIQENMQIMEQLKTVLKRSLSGLRRQTAL